MIDAGAQGDAEQGTPSSQPVLAAQHLVREFCQGPARRPAHLLTIRHYDGALPLPENAQDDSEAIPAENTQDGDEAIQAESVQLRLDGPLTDFAAHVAEKKGVRSVVYFNYRNLWGYASWLSTYDEEREQVAVLVDMPRIMEYKQEDSVDLDLCLVRIVLHEIGHLALHFTHIFPEDSPLGPGTKSTLDQEDEAWQFAGAVTGLALGDFARESRLSERRRDDAWIYA
jgi:hypothetical protein